jgi:ribulose-phosphate 3-epimerase
MVSRINAVTELPLDVHLMIDSPDKYIGNFCDAGADYISVHYENNIHLNRLINYIKSYKVKAGVAINPSTPVSLLSDIILDTDFVLIMSVNPGFGGQKYIPNSLEKVRELKKLINLKNPDCLIEIDGGISEDNIKTLAKNGVDMFVCGASIFKDGDKKKKTKKLKELIK